MDSRVLRLLLAAAGLSTSRHGQQTVTEATSASSSDQEQCSTYGQAANSDVELSWALLEGVGAFTRVSHTAASLPATATAWMSDRLVILGGVEYESAQPVVSSPVLVYDVTANTFASPTDSILSSADPTTVKSADEVFTSPASRADHASFADPSAKAVYVFGGQSREFLNDTWRLCLDSASATAAWDQLVVPNSDAAASVAAVPSPRIGHSITKVFENATFVGALVFGGLSDAYVELGGLHLALISKATSSCGSRSPVIRWRRLTATAMNATDGTPLPRAYHSAAAVSRTYSSSSLVCLLVNGGKSSAVGTIFDELWRLCPPANASVTTPVERLVYTWELLTPVGSSSPGARYGASVVFVDDGKLALAGGSYTFPNDFLSDVWELNVNATQWVRLRFTADFSPSRRGHTLAYFPPPSTGSDSFLLLFGGRDRYAVVAKRMERARYVAPFCAAGLKITFCQATSTYVCVPCPAGSYLEAGSRRCLSCPAGTFSAVGAASCTACPAGSYSPLTGMTSAQPCTLCPVGSASTALSATSIATCVACAAGSFASAAGSTQCTACPAGSFAPSNSTACSLCVAGTWSAVGAPTCSNCSAGTYTPKRGATKCLNCPKGFFSDSGGVTCSPCAANTTSSVVAASRAACTACPALSFTPTGLIGQTDCQYCPSGSTLNSTTGQCTPCPAGSFGQGATTNGACVSCSRGTYSLTAGSTSCAACPSGSITSSTGASSADACQFCALGQYLDGTTCLSCPTGYYPTSTGVCSTCLPGSYGSSSQSAQALSTTSPLGCSECASMTCSSTRGSLSCSACTDNAFGMTGWRTCISCASDTSGLSGCVTGRNGVLCSGNGECDFGGCKCADSWTGGDCSSALSTSATSASSPALFFSPPANVLVEAPVYSTLTTIDLEVSRAGALTSAVSAAIAWKADNFSSTPNTPSTVQFASGDRVKTLSIPISGLSPRTGCRYFTLQLNNVAGSGTSVVSTKSDREVTVYVDDMSGGATSSGSTRVAFATYTRRQNGLFVATVTLDRVKPTTLTLSPQTAASGANYGSDLRKQPLNLLFAIDPTSSIALDLIDLLPALVSTLQTTYTLLPDGIRTGLISIPLSASSTPATIFSTSIAEFFVNVRTVVTTARNTTYAQNQSYGAQWLLQGLGSSEFWPSSDRRFVITVGDNLLGDKAGAVVTVPAGLLAALHSQAAFVFQLSSQQLSFAGAAATVAQSVVYATSDDILDRVAQAITVRDAQLPTTVDTALDPAQILISCQPTSFASGSSSLPVLTMVLDAIPVPTVMATTNITVAVSIPGMFILYVQLIEPGRSCSPPVASLPTDPHPMSGWIESWAIATKSEVRQLWSASSPSLSLNLRHDTSLLFGWNSTVMSLLDTNTSRLTVTRTFPGSYFPPGLSLVLRGYWRLISNASTAACEMQLNMIGINTNRQSTGRVAFSSGDFAWTYGSVQRVVPWKLSSLRVVLDCNTSYPATRVEWATLGLLPAPEFACRCAKGFYNDVDLSSLDPEAASTPVGACVRCPAGYSCAGGIKTPCPDGTFSFGRAASCEACRDGWICIDGQARMCEPGTYSTAALSCAACPSGYACRNGKKTACPAGTYSPAMASDCQSCPPGSISRSEAYDRLLDCRVGGLQTDIDVCVVATAAAAAGRRRASCVRWDARPTTSATTASRVRPASRQPSPANTRATPAPPRAFRPDSLARSASREAMSRSLSIRLSRLSRQSGACGWRLASGYPRHRACCWV